MGGLHFDSLADLPPKMRAQVAGQLIAQGKEKKTPKYRNEPVTVKGIHFDSKKEAARYLQLKEAIRESVIYDLRLQRNFTLQEAYTTPEGKRIRAIVYTLGTVKVRMGTVDVTADVYADGVITIPAVTGDVYIIASGTAETTE